jgi:predicted PurR-regulated permease PerM
MADREDRKRVFNPHNLGEAGNGAFLTMNNRQIFAMILLGVMVGLGYWVVKPFLAPVAWAGILAFVTWPVYRRLLHPLESHRSIAALIMTTLLIILLVVPVLWLRVRARRTGRRVSDSFRETFRPPSCLAARRRAFR